MKNSLIWAVALGAVACSPESNTDLAQLQGERDSLVALTQTAATRIQEIDAQIQRCVQCFQAVPVVDIKTCDTGNWPTTQSN